MQTGGSGPETYGVNLGGVDYTDVKFSAVTHIRNGDKSIRREIRCEVDRLGDLGTPREYIDLNVRRLRSLNPSKSSQQLIL